jgi:hypothetical protein
MWRFVREHPIASISMVVGGLINVGSRMNDAYTLINLGLPASVWEAIGAAIFFGSVVALLYQWHKKYEATKTREVASTQIKPGFEFFPDREALRHYSHGSLARRFANANVTSVSAIWPVGRNFYDEGENLSVVKELLLPNPTGRAIKYLVQTAERQDATEFIKATTLNARKNGAKVKWYDHFIFHSIILADTDKPSGWMHIESALPYSQTMRRPSYTVFKWHSEAAVVEMRRVFQRIWDEAKEPSL